MRGHWLHTQSRPPVYYERTVAQANPRGTLVLLHGLASNATRWAEFVQHTGLRRDWNLLVPDLRGQGHSLDRGRQGLDGWADDIAALLDHEACDRAIVMGHCLGAGIAQRFVRRHPRRARGLILIEPMYLPALRGPLRRLHRLAPVLRALASVLRLGYRLGLYRRQYTRIDLGELDRRMREMTQGGRQRAAIRARYGAVRHDSRNMPLANYLDALLATTAEPGPVVDWPGPVLALLSSGSLLADSRVTAAMLDELPDCRVVQLDAEHWLPTECPQAMREAIEAWVEVRMRAAAA